MKFAPASPLLTALLYTAAARADSPPMPSSNSTLFSFNPLRFLQQFPLSSYASGSSKTPSANMSHLAPSISVSHGGGPMPILGDPMQAPLSKSMRTRVPKILKLGTPDQPRAIVLVTAHWSTSRVTISSAPRHELLFDYYGFPDEAYQLEYNAPGSPEVADEVQRLLKEAGIESKKDHTRGWDHGVFVPMMLINPKADIPIVQMSVLSSEDPAAHFAIGRALRPLRDQNVAIIGSGFASMHNLRAMFSQIATTPAFKALNQEWSAQVSDAVMTEDIEERGKKFEGWRKWKGAYEMHPRGGAEHFLPLVVCAGAGTGKAKEYSDEFMGLDMWSHYWDE